MLLTMLQLHSGLRYLVLLAGVVHLGYALFAVVTKQVPGKLNRVMSSAFMGLLHLQVIAGFVTLVFRGFYGALAGHLVMMLAAAAVATVLPARNRRRQTPSAALALASTAIALTC